MKSLTVPLPHLSPERICGESAETISVYLNEPKTAMRPIILAMLEAEQWWERAA
jgi:hypothetical protein